MSSLLSKPRIIEQFITQNPGKAVCYSGYREGQDPRQEIYPSHEEIREDLLILAKFWRVIRLYDCSQHAKTTLKVIRNEGLDLKVMLGVDMAAEISNPNCPWGAEFSHKTLLANRRTNSANVNRLITLANLYADIVFAVSIGNEASVEWTDHMVPVDNLVAYARRVRRAVPQPVTFCDNYVPWAGKLKPLAAELDFISVHTYPVWENVTIDNAIEYTKQNYRSVVNHFPNKPVVITEAGWTTASNGRGIDPANASEEAQAQYCRQLVEWILEERILTFVFEAFDEPWKGSADPLEPEKHWGLFYVDRTPKPAMQQFLPKTPKHLPR
ncbi:MAG: glycosyl hydrolase [Chloroflexi bacterium]|nr:glycosyl hydrolase [Chloroflexota bacterium]